MSSETMITVCSSCLQATCWQGLFYCDNYKSAGTVEKSVAELTELNLEHPSYWENDPNWPKEEASITKATATESETK